MSKFKRFTASISAHVDQLVSGIENHDAVIEAAIRDARETTARAKSRLGRFVQERERLERRLSVLQAAELQWAERATKTAQSDEDTALACLRRRRECQKQIIELNAAAVTQRKIEEKITADVRAAEARIQEMNQKRSLMRTRESAAEAVASFARLDNLQSINVDDAFERWETRVSMSEMFSNSTSVDLENDELERHFSSTEERDSLLAELHALTGEGSHE